MPHAHFVRGPTPVTVLDGEASYMRTAPGNGLSAFPLGREVLSEVGSGWSGPITPREAIRTWLHDSH